MGSRFVPLVLLPTTNIQDDKGKVYFRKTREEWFGKKLEDFSLKGPTKEGYWKALKETFDKIAGALDQNPPDSKWVAGGSEPTRADFIIASDLIWVRLIFQEGEKERRIEAWNNGRWGKMLKDTEQWQRVD